MKHQPLNLTTFGTLPPRDKAAVPPATRIRAYLRGELEAMRRRAAKGDATLFPVALIDSELERRDEIEDDRKDALIYPELQPSFR